MKEYGEKAPSKYIMYLDANILYGSALSQHLPTCCFGRLKEKEINRIELTTYKEDSKQDVMLEVDLEYPEEIHDLRNDYPLRPLLTQRFLTFPCVPCVKIKNTDIVLLVKEGPQVP